MGPEWCDHYGSVKRQFKVLAWIHIRYMSRGYNQPGATRHRTKNTDLGVSVHRSDGMRAERPFPQ